MSRSAKLGEMREVSLPQGTLRYRERGQGEPLVFLHGLLVNGDLWRNVVPELAGSYRCITPDLPLGSHDVPMGAGANLTPPAVATMVRDFLDALGIERATLIANDTGGAISQLVTTEWPERVERLILTPCDCFDIFPPKMFSYLKLLASVPGGIWAMAQTTRSRSLRKSPMAFGWLAKRGIEEEAARSYFEPCQRSAAIRRDTAKACLGLDPRHTLEAARRFDRFPRPVLVVWALEEKLFPTTYAERLARAFPNAHLEMLADCYTFIPEDRPEELARVIREFVEATPASADRRDAAAV
jgi:pimeloyl-ACP methyl ester carboxylesterase